MEQLQSPRERTEAARRAIESRKRAKLAAIARKERQADAAVEAERERNLKAAFAKIVSKIDRGIEANIKRGRYRYVVARYSQIKDEGCDPVKLYNRILNYCQDRYQGNRDFGVFHCKARIDSYLDDSRIEIRWDGKKPRYAKAGKLKESDVEWV